MKSPPNNYINEINPNFSKPVGGVNKFKKSYSRIYEGEREENEYYCSSQPNLNINLNNDERCCAMCYHDTENMFRCKNRKKYPKNNPKVCGIHRNYCNNLYKKYQKLKKYSEIRLPRNLNVENIDQELENYQNFREYYYARKEYEDFCNAGKDCKDPTMRHMHYYKNLKKKVQDYENLILNYYNSLNENNDYERFMIEEINDILF